MAMLKLGLVAYQNNRGLGIQTWEYYKNLKPARTLVLDTTPTHHVEQFPERYPDAWRVVPGLPTRADCDEFVSGLDVILMAENPPTYYMIEAARNAGVKSVVVPNYEFHAYCQHPDWPRPDLFMCPSLWHYEDVLEPKTFMHVPIVPRITKKPEQARKFLHVVGTPAVHDRNGTEDVLQSLQYVKAPISLTIKCQDTDYLKPLLDKHPAPENVKLIVDVSNTPNYWDNYKGFDAMVLPRRYGGLCLPLNEAIGAGMPVIMPDLEPNNLWLPKDWLVPSQYRTSFKAANDIHVHESSPLHIGRLMEKLATNSAFYQKAVLKAEKLAKENSWNSLKRLYLESFNSIIKP